MINTFAEKITRNPKKVIIIALLLMIPALLGMIITPINYDILSYLPKDLDSVQGLEILDEDFNAATMGIIVIRGMDNNAIYDAEDTINELEAVKQVLWLGSASESPIPLSMLPEGETTATEYFQPRSVVLHGVIVQYHLSSSLFTISSLYFRASSKVSKRIFPMPISC